MSHGICIQSPAGKPKNLALVFGLSILAGMVMGAFGFAFHAVGWMQKSGMVINASMVLPPELMDTFWMPVAGMLVHMLFSGVFGVVFFIGIIFWKYVKLPGNVLVLSVLYGIGLYVVNAGIMAPVMDLHPPFWQMPFSGALSSFVARLIYSTAVAVFLLKWATWPDFLRKK